MNVCLICNSQVPASACLRSQGQGTTSSWVEDVRILFKLFEVDSSMLTSTSGVFSSTPYCPTCLKCIQQLNQLMDRLDAIQKQIRGYQDQIGRSVIQTFASTSNWATVYQWKRMIFEKISTGEGHNPNIPSVTGSSSNPTNLELISDIAHTSAASEYCESVSSSSHYFEDQSGVTDITGEVTVAHESSPKRKNNKRIRPAQSDNLRQDVMKNQKTQCEFCSKVFSVPLNLARHIIVHTGDKPYSCSYCDLKFRDSSNKKRHEKRLHGVGPPDGTCPCDLCDAVYYNSASLYSHKRDVHLKIKKAGTEKEPSECRICGSILSCRRNLNTHIRVLHNLQFKVQCCPICDKPFKSPLRMRIHQESHKSLWELELEGKTFYYKCTACEHSFTSRLKLWSHQSFEHPEEKFSEMVVNPSAVPFKCPDCPGHPGFRSKRLLQKHLYARHPSRKSEKRDNPMEYSCKICSKPMQSSSTAKSHELIHDPSWNNPFPFVCSKCPPISGMFGNKEDFDSHYQVKHPKCKIPEVIPITRILKKHPAVCEVCEHKPLFASMKGLKRHVAHGHPKCRGKKGAATRTRKRAKCRRQVSSSEDSESETNEKLSKGALEWVKVKVEPIDVPEEDLSCNNDEDNSDSEGVSAEQTKLKQFPVIKLVRIDNSGSYAKL